jgi:flavin reductase (DIM6/NTAB) family NADH-FMN oxidoreductase RutF
MNPALTTAGLRAALGRFATGVTIVTARSPDGRPVGLTVNSFNSVSLEPPRVLWSLSQAASSMPTFAAGVDYAIHVLAADQRGLAERFASKGVDRWQGLAYREGLGGVPLLDGAVAVFECRQRSRYPEGDHVIFVGDVLRCQHRSDLAPLLYHGGRFYTEHPL